MTGAIEIKKESWVKESAFGTWFTGTQIWAKYVLIKAMDDLEPMIRNRKQDYPVILDVGCGHGLSFTMLEKKFKPGMTLSNYGKWHIDHVKPVAKFDLTISGELEKCFHYTNLQPLWALDNLKKGKKF